jgi:predicted TPR repeat methyltransferase
LPTSEKLISYAAVYVKWRVINHWTKRPLDATCDTLDNPNPEVHAFALQVREGCVMPTKELLDAASSSFNSGRRTEAEAICRQALRESPNATYALYVLGMTHSDRGDDYEAGRLFRQALFFSPRFVAPYIPLSFFYYATNQVESLRRLLREWNAVDPDDPEVRHLMAAVDGTNVPQYCDERYIQKHFNSFAHTFDNTLLQKLAYQGPRIVAAALEKHFSASHAIEVLDAGCGTGLCGAAIRHRCRTLVGADLAEQMVEIARKRECYDELIVGEICAVMETRSEGFDAIVSADVLIYFGVLDRFMRSARSALRPGGLLIVTTESLPEESTEMYRLGPSGRYAHRRAYVKDALEDAGLDVVEIRDEFIRGELGKSVMGHCAVARRRTETV